MTPRALTAAVLLALACAAALGCIAGGGGDDPAPTSTPAAPVAATPAATVAPAATPAPTSTATPTPAPTAAPPSSAAPDIDGVPFSLDDFASALPAPGLTPTDEFEPACPGASAAPVVFTGPDGGAGGPYAVWVIWVYADHEAFKGDWAVDENFRVAPLLDGCEPPNGFVYWNENLVLWFAGLYGGDLAPGSLPATADEVRGHPVVRTFLELTWQ